MSYPNAEPAQYPSGPTDTAPITPPPPYRRRSQAYAGGLIAGMAIAVALVVVLHVIQVASPNGPNPPCSGYGCAGYSIAGYVFLVLVLGLIIGLGLGMGLAAAVPDRTADSATARHAVPGRSAAGTFILNCAALGTGRAPGPRRQRPAVQRVPG